MEAALAELSVEDVKDEADDKDFIIVRGEDSLLILPRSHIFADEEDVFGSDFESTDEEAETAQQTADAGERQVKAEERREKKVDFFGILPIYRLIIQRRLRRIGSRELLLSHTLAKG